MADLASILHCEFLTFRVGLLGRASWFILEDFCRSVSARVAALFGAFFTFMAESRFSWELGGSIASLSGTGVVCLMATVGLGLDLESGVVFGKEFAFVVSFKHEDCLVVGDAFARGDDAAAAGEEGGAFWKKETIERCLAEEVVAAGLVALAGVRAAVDRWLAMVVNGLSSAQRLNVLGRAIDRRESGKKRQWDSIR